MKKEASSLYLRRKLYILPSLEGKRTDTNYRVTRNERPPTRLAELSRLHTIYKVGGQLYIMRRSCRTYAFPRRDWNKNLATAKDLPQDWTGKHAVQIARNWLVNKKYKAGGQLSLEEAARYAPLSTRW
jgi:hypothetical protein